MFPKAFMFPKAECTYIEEKFSHSQTLPLSLSPPLPLSGAKSLSPVSSKQEPRFPTKKEPPEQ